METTRRRLFSGSLIVLAAFFVLACPSPGSKEKQVTVPLGTLISVWDGTTVSLLEGTDTPNRASLEITHNGQTQPTGVLKPGDPPQGLNVGGSDFTIALDDVDIQNDTLRAKITIVAL